MGCVRAGWRGGSGSFDERRRSFCVRQRTTREVRFSLYVRRCATLEVRERETLQLAHCTVGW